MQYSDSDIQTLSDIDHMRQKRTAYVTSNGADGVTHLIREILDNSFDELGAIKDPKAEIHLTILRCHELNEVIVAVKDTGRGIPLGKVKDVFTVARTSGKFRRTVYKDSAGLLGIGSTVSFALSRSFRSIVSREGELADITMSYNNFSDKTVKRDYLDKMPIAQEKFQHGTYVFLLPDPEIFVNMQEFLEDGVNNLLTLLKIINYFSDYNLYMHVDNVTSQQFRNYEDIFFNDNKEDGHTYTETALQTIEMLNEKVDSLYYTPADKMSKDSQIREFFNIAQWKEVTSFVKEQTDDEDPLYINFKCYLGSKHHETANCTLSVVNNIVFRNHEDSQIAEFRKALKLYISPYIKDKDVQQFFLNKYVFPFYYVVHVRFTDAEFTGTTKDKFVDEKFKKVYSAWLHEYFDKNKNIVEEIYNLIDKDILTKFKNVRDNSMTSKMSSLTAQLHFPRNFRDCLEYGEDAELFICEGKSATQVTSRDSRFQAIFGLFGKPFNSISDEDNIDKSLNALLKNKLFQDVFTIIGVRPNDPTLEGLRFNKIFLTTDADEHGKHIANIILANIWIYNPALLTKFKVYITMPPLYKLSINGKDTVFAKNQEEYIKTLADEVYSKQYVIEMKTDDDDGTIITLKKDELIDVANKIFEMGLIIDNLSNENDIPTYVMEAIVTHHLNKDIVEEIWSSGCECLQDIFDAELVEYDPESTVLTVSYDTEDVVIYMGSLILDATVDRYWLHGLDNKCFRVSDKRATQKQREANPWFSPMVLYQFLSNINKKYTSEKLKGLGSMIEEDMYITCMHPDTRYDYQLKKMDNVVNIFRYLGDDPIWRKRLMSSYSEVAPS